MVPDVCILIPPFEPFKKPPAADILAPVICPDAVTAPPKVAPESTAKTPPPLEFSDNLKFSP